MRTMRWQQFLTLAMRSKLHPTAPKAIFCEYECLLLSRNVVFVLTIVVLKGAREDKR